MRAFILLVASLIFMSAGRLLAAQTSSLAILRSPDAMKLAQQLEAEGFDVVEGSVEPGALQLVLSPQSWAVLEQRGLALQLVAVGRPYLEIQRESQGAALGGVPSGYSNLAGVLARMGAAASAHPTRAKLVDLTTLYGTPATAEGRHIFALKISDNVAVDEDEPNVLIVGNHHAREIVTPEIALTAMEQLLNNYASNPAVAALVDSNEIWIAPVWNPDGYEHVFQVDNFWRKNRRNNGNGTFGVDLNRNYEFGWSSACSGGSSGSDDTYKGPAPGSEPETQTMVAFSNARRFAKVIDYHSSGREVLWAYAPCLIHPFGVSWLKPEAISLSIASGYGGAERPPTADGEHYEWQLARFANFAFLIETHVEFQPSYASAKAEATQLWGGVEWTLARNIPLAGHVTDAVTGAPVAANVKFTNLAWQNGETNSSGGAFGRYYGALPAGTYTLEFSAPCYQSQSKVVNVSASGAQVVDVALVRLGSVTTYCTAKTSSSGCLPQISSSGEPSLSAPTAFTTLTTQLESSKSTIGIFSSQGASAMAFQGGTLCIASPIVRLPVKNSGGGSVCGGTASYNLSEIVAAAGAGVIGPGTQVWVQTWGRDPADAFGSSLSNALTFSACP